MEPVANPGPARSSRRRRGMAAFGLVALPLVGSAFVLPAVAGAEPAATVQAPAPVETATGSVPAAFVRPGTEPPAAPATDPVQTDEQAAVEAYLAAGYSFDDALVLAQRWSVEPDPFAVKVKAGAFLAEGTPLRDAPLSDPAADDGVPVEQLVDVFFAQGYTGDDAAVLAEEWGIDLGEAKVKAGGELKVVGVLPHVDPVPADGGYVPNPADDAAITAFFDAGYDYGDAGALAAHWGLAQPFDAKLKAGALLRADQPLPTVAGLDD